MFLKGAMTMKKDWRIIGYVMCILMVLTSAACMTSLNNYGQIAPDRNVTNVFKTYQINPNYNYYISGSDTHPNAIMGLDKAYKLEPDLWKPVDMTPQKLRELVIDTENYLRSMDIRLVLQGYTISDDQGKQIGIWYSILAATKSVMMKDDRTVIIITPDIDTYLRYDNR